MKKIISSLVASGMLIAAVAPSYASAINISPLNELSVESSVLTEGITVDGNYIPSGSLAVTVSINNNTGFDNSATTIELGDAYTVIDDSENIPVLTNQNVLEDFILTGSYDDDSIVVVSASAELTDANGKMFTFYLDVDENNTDRTIEIINKEESASVIPPINSPNYTINFTYGDVNSDGIIDGRDATRALTAYSIYLDECGTTEPSAMNDPTVTDVAFGLSPLVAAGNVVHYFYSYIACPWAADTTINGYINKKDAEDILKYYACSMTDSTYSGNVGNPGSTSFD